MDFIKELLSISEQKMKLSEILNKNDDAAIKWLDDNFVFDSEHEGDWNGEKIWAFMSGAANDDYVKIPYITMRHFDIKPPPFDLDKACKNFDRYIKRYPKIWTPEDKPIENLDGIFQFPHLHGTHQHPEMINFNLTSGGCVVKSFECANPGAWLYEVITLERDVCSDTLKCNWLDLFKLPKLKALSIIGEGGHTDVDEEISAVFKIVNKHLKGDRDEAATRKELVDHGLGDYAK